MRSLIFRLATLAYHRRILFTDFFSQSSLWIDYKKEHPNGYQLAPFYKLYRDFMVDTYGTSKTSMPVERIPGEKMFIDWVGDQPELLLDTATGELQKVHIFTTTLGFSSLVYAEIFQMKNFHILLPVRYMHCLIMEQFLNILSQTI